MNPAAPVSKILIKLSAHPKIAETRLLELAPLQTIPSIHNQCEPHAHSYIVPAQLLILRPLRHQNQGIGVFSDCFGRSTKLNPRFGMLTARPIESNRIVSADLRAAVQ